MSDADRAAERLVTELLRGERPDDGLVAEEGSSAESASGRRWLVDPLDGTTNFLYRYPAWSVSIALEDDCGGLVGVVHDPLRGETFRASRGSGAELNGRPIAVRGQDRLETALIATGFGYAPELRTEQAATLTRLLPRVRDLRRAGSAALDLSWVACGRVDGYFERGLSPWDWSAGRLLVAEAGGAVLELPGEPFGLVAGPEGIVARLRDLAA